MAGLFLPQMVNQGSHFEHNVALVNGKPELLSTFKYVYDALGINSNEEDEFRSAK